ncbi:hypothetical protein GLOTRDRAFT_126727 [Gloeophyllum trabeum ATCC 11539]|uniref:Cryptic loci regulator 2 N-terminal domain-containing protein n=1 Tax=Gloeophyllum trabeum (strain ATCC 11539 / FP-39264 / Madison 617) TaxID=670483 RepID=S7QFN0_GLOTA|nr:uncharacterized protein GLOTRDRAFT_126727 [Gloeophyllum trabeum ATCC 11539]EPQ58237.1 hypothetical protein GLOTRDRAFT_126727 [Gloeophyllum trabeum ATCC 11539]
MDRRSRTTDTFQSYNTLTSSSYEPARLGKRKKAPTYEVETIPDTEIVQITLLRSDGDISRWPSDAQTTRKVDDYGHVDYFVKASDKELKLWRKKIGRFLAAYPLRADGLSLDPAQCYLKSFPPGYILMTRLSGDKDVPRRDCYLYGGKRRYESPAEWCLHAKWLVEDCPMKPSGSRRQCECIDCDGTVPQSTLSGKYNLNAVDDTRGGRKQKKGGRKKENVDRPIIAKDYTKMNHPTVQIFPSVSGSSLPGG